VKDTLHDPLLAGEPELAPLSAVEEERLATALRAAFAPTELDPARHERILAAALEDPFAPPSAEELVESDRLRRALEGEGEHADLALARALAAAHAPKPLPPAARERSEARLPRRATVFYVRFGAALGALAAAALVLLSIRGQRTPNTAAPDLQTLALAQSRSTAPMFQAATAGPPSARIDRIASVRERELRENRYALWGVR